MEKVTETKITDKHGDSLIIESYPHVIHNEDRVQISLDNDKQAIRDLIEEHDLKVDLSKVEFVEHLKQLLADFSNDNEEYMAVTETERKIIDASRDGADIGVNWFFKDKAEAEKLTRAFGRPLYQRDSEDKLGWFSSVSGNVRAVAFIDEE